MSFQNDPTNNERVRPGRGKTNPTDNKVANFLLPYLEKSVSEYLKKSEMSALQLYSGPLLAIEHSREPLHAGTIRSPINITGLFKLIQSSLARPGAWSLLSLLRLSCVLFC